MKRADVIIVGSGVSGLYCALNLPENKNILIVTKGDATESDSYLAQGGICVLRDDEDYESFFEDTLKAGHYENNKKSVDIMIKSSGDIIEDLISYGVRFEKDGNGFTYTKEGAHSRPRILYHKDITGQEITSHLLKRAIMRDNITIVEHFTMVDWLMEDNECFGIIGKNANGEYEALEADYTVLATGGIGGLFAHSTNYPHLTGDALALSLQYGVKLKNLDYIQIHPTTFYSPKGGRKFLISESVRGEGGMLFNHKKQRFVNELLPRDVVSAAIYEEMEKEGTDYEFLSFENIEEEKIKEHFPNIYEFCLKEGFDITRESIPVVPAQHYFMGGIDVNEYSKTSAQRLYAVGETACNGVHGKNRLASNSLLESLVFAKRAAKDIREKYKEAEKKSETIIDENKYQNFEQHCKEKVLEAIKKEKSGHEQYNNEIKR